MIYYRILFIVQIGGIILLVYCGISKGATSLLIKTKTNPN